MAYIHDANQIDPNELDFSELCCPKCGCNGVKVLKYPKAELPRRENGKWRGAWFGASGRAECELCKIIFPIQLSDD